MSASAFHRVRFSWDSGSILEIEWAGGKEGAQLSPPSMPNLIECCEERELDELGRRGIPPICWRAREVSAFEPFQFREDTEYLVDITLPLSRGEALQRWSNESSWPLSTVRYAYQSDPPKRWRETAGNVTVTGRLNFRSYVGLVELCPWPGDVVVGEVVCSKLGYFDDFRMLLDAIADEYVNLLLEVEAPTFGRFSVSEASEEQLLTFLFLLRHTMDDSQLPVAMETILRSPRNRFSTSERVVPVALLQDGFRPELLWRADESTFEPGGPLAGLFAGHSPGRLPERIKQESRDTPENRYVRSFLEDLLERTEGLRAALHRRGRRQVARQVEQWYQQIFDWVRNPVWSEVKRMTHFPSNSQVLQKGYGYRDILATDIRLQFGLSVPWHIRTGGQEDVHGDLRPISQLYEYWCFFFLRSVLRQLCGPEIAGASSLIREGQGGLAVVLRRGEQSKLTFRYEGEGGRNAVLTLFYNRRFVRIPPGQSAWNGSYSAVFNPDFSIMICTEGGEGRTHWLHFDAKYRLDFTQWTKELGEGGEIEDGVGGSIEETAKTVETYKRSDLFKMHTYRDAVLGSRGSYVLFPGARDEETVFIRYPGAENGDGRSIPSVGAFQANPRRQREQAQKVEIFVSRCIEELVRGASYQEETGPTPAARILNSGDTMPIS